MLAGRQQTLLHDEARLFNEVVEATASTSSSGCRRNPRNELAATVHFAPGPASSAGRAPSPDVGIATDDAPANRISSSYIADVRRADTEMLSVAPSTSLRYLRSIFRRHRWCDVASAEIRFIAVIWRRQTAFSLSSVAKIYPVNLVRGKQTA